MRRALVPLLLLALLPGCFVSRTTVGVAPPERAAAALEIGRTTKAQALARLGAPQVVRRQADGDLLIWRRTEAHVTGLLLIPFVPLYRRTDGASRDDMIALLFDQQGILRGVGT